MSTFVSTNQLICTLLFLVWLIGVNQTVNMFHPTVQHRTVDAKSPQCPLNLLSLVPEPQCPLHLLSLELVPALRLVLRLSLFPDPLVKHQKRPRAFLAA
jgi:hypothetical protein